MKIIQAKGSLRAIGRQVGEETRQEIRSVFSALEPQLAAHPAFKSREEIDKSVLRWTADTCRVFPEAGQWLIGLAEGAGDFSSGTMGEPVAAISWSEELLAMPTKRPERCSTLAVPSCIGYVVGHNEDYGTEFGPLFVLDMLPDGFPRTVSLNYPGQLPCLAGTLSERGFCITHNSLPGDAVIGRPSLQAMHFRANLSESFEKALEQLSRSRAAIPAHFTLAGAGSVPPFSIELDALTDGPGMDVAVMAQDEAFCHTNHALTLRGSEGSESSRARLGKLQADIKAGVVPKSPAEMMAYLSRPDGVVRRLPGAEGDSVTLATVVIRPETSEFWVRGHAPGDQLIKIRL